MESTRKEMNSQSIIIIIIRIVTSNDSLKHLNSLRKILIRKLSKNKIQKLL